MSTKTDDSGRLLNELSVNLVGALARARWALSTLDALVGMLEGEERETILDVLAHTEDARRSLRAAAALHAELFEED